MKFTPFLIMLSSLLFASCNNHPKTYISDQRSNFEPAKPDTPNCSALIKSLNLGNTMHCVTTVKALIIKDGFKPMLQVDVNRMDVIPVHQLNAQLELVFRIDSAFCVDQDTGIVITFTDSSSITIANVEKSNCTGKLEGSFNPNINFIRPREAAAEVQKARTTKIRSITFTTQQGYRTYNLPDATATELMGLIDCVLKAK